MFGPSEIELREGRRWYDALDSRTKDMWFIKSPYQVPMILILYLVLVYLVTPWYMKNRKAYNLKTFTRFYNLFQIIANGLITYISILLFKSGDLSIYCFHGEESFAPGPYKIALLMWYIMLLKIVDLVETIVFILRKKDKQVSFLHVYHHTTVVFLVWLYSRYTPRGMTIVPLILNSFVHTLMYSYYLASTIKSLNGVTKRVKRAMTIVQLVQFIFMFVHSCIGLLPSCGLPIGLMMLGQFEILSNFFLFLYFYNKTYKAKQKAK